MKIKKDCWYFVKKINKKPYYFNPRGRMDHLMDGKHKVKCVDIEHMYFYDPITNNIWFIRKEELQPLLRTKLINILNR